MSLVQEARRAYQVRSKLALKEKVDLLIASLQVALNIQVRNLDHSIGERGRIYIESLGFDIGPGDSLQAVIYCMHETYGYNRLPIKTEYGAVTLDVKPGCRDQNYATIGEAISKIPCDQCKSGPSNSVKDAAA